MLTTPEYSDAERKLFKSMRVAVLSPIMYVYPRFVQSLANMIAFSWVHGIRVEEMAITERTVVDWAREDLVTQALERKSPYGDKDITHFLWLDSDMIFKPDLCCQLARHDVEMVSALYFSRLMPHKPVVYVRNQNDPAGLSHFPILELPPRLCKVDAFGFGSCLIRREVFEKVPKPWFTIDWRGGEDIAFCAKAAQHGIQAWCDGQYTVAHVGENKIITVDSYRQWYKENEETIKANRVQIELGGK